MTQTRDGPDDQRQALAVPHLCRPFHRRGLERALSRPIWPRGRPACRSPSICRPRPAMTATIRWRGARSARSACPSAIWATCGRCLPDIPLDQMNTSMTINATAPWLLALYIAVAEEQGADIAALQGTVQNDIIKEYLSRGTYICPPEPSPADDHRCRRLYRQAPAQMEPDERLQLSPARGRGDAGTGTGLRAGHRLRRAG